MKYFFLSFLFLCQFKSQSQSVLFGKFEDHVDGLISLTPGSSGSQYQDPTEEDLMNWEVVIDLIIANDLEEASIKSMAFDYEVIKFIDNSLSKNQEFVILQKMSSGSNFWGSYIFNANACRDLVLQCPHPRFDSNTGKQGAYIFTRLSASAMLLSGTHRCNNPIPSGCSGNTSACGSSSPYRKSDPAHNAKSMFQLTTEILAENEKLLFIQLHGFAKSSSDPNLILSNGTRNKPDIDPIINLQNGLLEANPALTFKTIHIDTDWTKLTAFTNTQGRYLNESSNSCSQNASVSSGRFIHIEQELDLFRKNSAGWELMFQGLSNAFDCLSSSTHDELLRDFYKIVDGQVMISSEYETDHSFEIYNLEGSRIHGKYPPRNTIFCLILREKQSGSIIKAKKLYLN